MILTDYEQEMFENLERINGKNWYIIQTNRKDREFFVDAIKTRINMKGDFEFNDDYTKFRRIEPFSEFIKRVDAIVPRGEIGCSIEFRDISEVTFDYSHLPEPKFSDDNKKTKRRAV